MSLGPAGRVLHAHPGIAPYPGLGSGSYMTLSATFPAVKPLSDHPDPLKKINRANSAPERMSDMDVAAKRLRVCMPEAAGGGTENGGMEWEARSSRGEGTTHADQSDLNDLPASRSTDFSHFMSNIRASQGGKDRGGAHAPAAPAGGGDAFQRLATFADIANKLPAQAPLVREESRLQSLKNLSVSARFKTPGRDASNMPGAAPTQLVGAGPEAAGSAAARDPLVVEHMVYDWSLKSCVRLTSCQRLTSCERALRLSSSQAAHAQQAFMGHSLESIASADKRVYAALLSWRFPESSWDAATVVGLQAAAAGATAGTRQQNAPSGSAPAIAKGPSAVLMQRLSLWRSALRSMYHAMREGQCAAFYVISEGPRPFVALFCAGQARGGDAAPHVVLSQSSKSLRHKLSAAGLEYSMPLAPVARDERFQQQAVLRREANDEDFEVQARGKGEEEEELVGQQQPAAAGQARGSAPHTLARDNTPQSLLLFTGGRAVHGLFDYLLNETSFQGSMGEAMDVPTLLAPFPFEGAVIKQEQLKNRGATGTMGSAAQPDVPDRQGAYVMELSGHIPPWTVYRLCHALRDAQYKDLQVQLETDPNTLGLNIEYSCSGAEPQGVSDVLGGAQSYKEAAAMSEVHARLRRRIIKAITCQPDGTFALKLS